MPLEFISPKAGSLTPFLARVVEMVKEGTKVKVRLLVGMLMNFFPRTGACSSSQFPVHWQSALSQHRFWCFQLSDESIYTQAAIHIGKERGCEFHAGS